MKKKEVKIVFYKDKNQYAVMITDHKGEWGLCSLYSTFDNDGKVIEGKHDGLALMSENIVWEINKCMTLGWKFIGIERK